MKKIVILLILLLLILSNLYSQENDKIQKLATLSENLEMHLNKLDDYSKLYKEDNSNQFLFLTLNYIIELADIRLELQELITMSIYDIILSSVEIDDTELVDYLRNKQQTIKKALTASYMNNIEKIILLRVIIKSDTVSTEINSTLEKLKEITLLIESL